MARVVVAGGAGFIGSYVCESLVNRGDHVVAIDNLVTGRPDNVAGLLGHERFALVEHDVCQPLERAGALGGPRRGLPPRLLLYVRPAGHRFTRAGRRGRW